MKLMMRRLLVFFVLLGFSVQSYAQSPDKIDSLIISPTSYTFQKPKPFTFIKRIPGDVYDYGRVTFRKKNLWKIGAMVAGTAVLVVLDQPIIDNAKVLGDKLGLSHESHQSTFFDVKIPVGSKKIDLPLNGPTDLNTSMYFLGDGITHFSIAGCFWVYGLIDKNNRAKQTATQLTEAILTTGFATQFLKHITGRESPYTSSVPGGLWRVFPNQVEYANDVPSHDAFPSGHLATAMATVTVIAENYPEYKFIRPVGYSLMTLLSFAMLNNGVHWASDYPLALAMGYTFGKIAVVKGRVPLKISLHKTLSPVRYGYVHFSPVFFGNTTGGGMLFNF